MTICKINTHDRVGGAALIASSLHDGFQRAGYTSLLIVGRTQQSSDHIIPMANRGMFSIWSRGWNSIGLRLSRALGDGHKAQHAGALIAAIGSPRRYCSKVQGHEDFDFPRTATVLTSLPAQPDIFHCHNLHGDYFDLRFLSQLCKMAPVVMTLHDAWLLSGHCAHSFECDRWLTGCGSCPDLSIPPALLSDGTAFNWHRKREIYAQCRFYVATPSQWLMDKVRQSILQPAIIESRVIPNGIDLTVFHPQPKAEARSRLGIQADQFVMCFSANGIRQSQWKDWQTMRRALELTAQSHPGTPITFLAIGESAPSEQISNARIEFVPHTSDPSKLADYYRASDLYLHAAKADTFPNTVIEALACGTPVVATAVGGIPEQVKGLEIRGQVEQRLEGSGLNTDDRRLATDDRGVENSITSSADQHKSTVCTRSRPLGAPSGSPSELRLGHPMPSATVSSHSDLSSATGILTPPGDAEAMAKAIEFLIRNPDVRKRLGENAARDAKARFSLDRMVNDYLSWYREILAKRG